MFKAVTPLHVPIVHFMMEESENAENVSSSIFLFLYFQVLWTIPRYFFFFISWVVWGLTCHQVEVDHECYHENSLSSEETRDQGDVDPEERLQGENNLRLAPDQVVDGGDDRERVGAEQDAEKVEDKQGDVDPTSDVADGHVHLRCPDGLGVKKSRSKIILWTLRWKQNN